MPTYYSQFNFSKIPVLGLVPESSASAPASPVAGQLWTDTSLTPPLVKIYDGSAWHPYNETPDASITDAKVATGAAIALSKLATNPLARANHTGTQTASTISDFDTQVRTTRLDQMAASAADLNLGGFKATNAAAPVNGGDLVNKTYADNLRAGISVKDPVRVVAASNVNLASPGATIDGVTMAVGNRFLAANQTTASQNGIYDYKGPSTAAVRSYDAANAAAVPDGAVVAVAEGTSASQQWIQTADTTSNPQWWSTFSMGGQSYTAGNGLQLVGSAFSLVSPVSVANGGTGASTAAAARTALGVGGGYSTTVLNSAFTPGTPVTITHNLNTNYVGAFFIAKSTGKNIQLDWTRTSANAITATADITIGDDVDILVVGY